MYLRQSTASQEILLGRFVDSTDGNTEETGLSIANTDIWLFKGGTTTVVSKNAGGATHISNGLYSAVLDATDTNTVGELEVHVHVAGALSVARRYYVLEEAVYDGFFAASAPGYISNAPVNVAQFGGSNGTFSGGRPEVNTSHWGGTAVGSANVRANLTQILGTAPTEGGAGRLAGAFTTLFDVASPVLTAASVNQTGESFARLGAPAGASVSADIAAVKAQTAAIETDTQDIQARLPAALTAGGNIKADVLAISGDTTAADNLEAAADGTGYNLGGGSVVAASVTGAVGSVTGNVGGNVAGSVGSVTGNVGGNVTGTVGGFTAAAKAEIQAEAEDALVAHRLDELLNADSDIDGAAPPTVGSVFHELMSKTAGSFTFDQTTDSCEAIRDRGDAAWTTATGFSTHSAADVWAVATRTLTAGTNINGSTFTAIPWNASWDAEVESEVTDALTAAGYNSTRAGYLDELAAANLPADVDQIKADLPNRVTKNTALAGFTFPMVLASDHVSAATGKTVTATRSIDGGAFAACANAVTEVSGGFYKIDLAASDLNGNVVSFLMTATACDPTRFTIVTEPT